jgi:hypothetical protein
MTRERIGSLVLRAYPRASREVRGPEMLSMLLDAGETSGLEFTRECGSLLVGGLRERTHRRGRSVMIFAAGAVAAIFALGALRVSSTGSSPAHDKNNLRKLAGAMAPRLQHGDLVLLAQPGLTPVAYKYLPAGLRYVTPLGLDNQPGMSPHYTSSNLAGSYPRAYLNWLLKTLASGQRVLFIRALTEGNADWSSHRSALLRLRAAQLGALLQQDRELRVVAWAPHNYHGSCCVTDTAQLYVKS